jgi:protein-S-isoprenylcysteine O-methyltransferase Ste14
MRRLLAILALPFMVVVVVPTLVVWTARDWDTRWPLEWPEALIPWGFGLALWLGGFILSAWCVRLFARVGRGTLAPWAPTRRLVVVGPYRHVRNPMISGVLAMLLGESVGLGSAFLLAWAAGFWLLNHLYFVASEEPGLLRRFGEAYQRYRAEVPRWVPRWSPWVEPAGAVSSTAPARGAADGRL